MRSFLHSFFVGILALAASVSLAQNSVDIALVPNVDDELEVRIRFENDFDGYFAASVFTIRWSNASGASLGPLIQDPTVQDYHDVNTSGPMQVENGYRYQIFAGFGGLVLSDIPLTLMAGEWITLCRIPVVNGTDAFSIVNDGFTAASNGDFYISLGGQESQGEIIDLNTAIAVQEGANGSLDVFPSITNDRVTVSLVPGGDPVQDLTLLDANGREVWSRALGGQRGPVRVMVDLSSYDAGAYVVRMRSESGVRTARVVKH